MRWRSEGPYVARACCRVGALSWVVLLFALGACGGGWTADLPGTYVLDRAAYIDAAYARRLDAEAGALEQLGHLEARREREAVLRKEAVAESNTVRMRVDLQDDGTFRVAYRYPQEEGHASGRWRTEGDRLRLETTSQGRRPLKHPQVAWGARRTRGFVLTGSHVPLPIPLIRAARAR